MMHRLAFDDLLTQAQQLPVSDQLRLIARLAQDLPSVLRAKPKQRLIYGQFRGSRLSTEEDFKIAEWQPTEQDLNGA
jgi:formate dehydrogenase maturation protein FdhE